MALSSTPVFGELRLTSVDNHTIATPPSKLCISISIVFVFSR